jgi:hypothetical protein
MALRNMAELLSAEFVWLFGYARKRNHKLQQHRIRHRLMVFRQEGKTMAAQ